MKDVPEFMWHEDDDRERVAAHAGYLLDRMRFLITGLMMVQDGDADAPTLDEVIVEAIIADEQASGRSYSEDGDGDGEVES